MKPINALAAFAAALTLSIAAGPSVAQGPRNALPNPVLYMSGQEAYSINGTSFIRYRFDVLNKDQYPAQMFAAAPGLPPCGANTNSARTWVDFYENRTNRRIYGFCALGSPNDLSQIWFAVPEGTVPPSYVYIELNDRQTNTKYRSNLADTTL